MANFLVTGGAGFIGSHLTARFVELGHSVRVLDNLITGKRENLAHIDGEFEFIEGDLRQPEVCKAACRDIDVVFHEAAFPSVPKSVDDPQLTHDINVNGTHNLLLAARDAKVKRVVYAASSSAYGDVPESPKHEGIVPEPLSPYACHKLMGEFYCRAFYECYGLETISLRYFNVFGPRQDPASQYAAAVPVFVTAIAKDRSPTVYDDGEQTRDFTYIENIIHGNLLAADAAATHGETINVACGEQISLNDIIARINELLGKNVPIEYAPPRAGDVKHSLADIRLAKQVIGYTPVVSFGDGLQKAIDWYAANTKG